MEPPYAVRATPPHEIAPRITAYAREHGRVHLYRYEDTLTRVYYHPASIIVCDLFPPPLNTSNPPYPQGKSER